MVTFINLETQNASRWKAAKLTRDFTAPAKKAIANKAIYQQIEKTTGVPWVFIAASHYRESSQDFSTNLAQGDPWNQVSTHVPKGRGPFKSFVEAAVDALVNCSPYAARNKDWSLPALLTYLEEYNGLGYANHGIPSPYLWSGTNIYSKGKYVADGRFDPNVVDKQLGCAGLIMTMMNMDKTISFDPHTTETHAETANTVVPAAPASFWKKWFPT